MVEAKLIYQIVLREKDHYLRPSEERKSNKTECPEKKYEKKKNG